MSPGPGGAAEELSSAISSYIQKHRSGEASASTSAAAVGSSSDPRFDLLRSVGEECQTEAELKSLLQKKPSFNLYDGFEPSGRMHIAQGVFKAINVNKCTKAGGTFIFWVADWFALMNDKMGGDLDKIKTVGKYLIEVWKASGMDMTNVKFVWCSDEITQCAQEYWGIVLDVARRSTLTRVKRCCQIMGRSEDSLTAAQILYPLMQCSDIFFLRADICQLGVDQRKVNMLAREYCESAGKKEKPIILSHHMLYGLKAGQAKMSKSDPDSAVFMEDTPEDVERKIRNAYCPRQPEAAAAVKKDDEEMSLVKDDLKNPCLDYVKNILFCKEGFTLKTGGKTFSTYEEVKSAFVAGEISEEVLKTCLITELNVLLEPVRQHFQNNETAKDLLSKVRQYKKETFQPTSSVTRLQLIKDTSTPVFAVFAPLPSEAVQLELVLGVLARLRAAPSGAQVVLWLQDWSARCLGRAGGSEACIKGFYELLLFGLRTLAPEVMKAVRVCWQGESILSGPSEYWISAINVGRRSSVETVRGALPEGENLESASQVVTALMHGADALALCGSSSLTCCGDRSQQGLHQMASKHCEACGLPSIEFKLVETPKLRLLQDGEGVEADVNVLLTDSEIEVNKRMKKSFCEPSNVGFCPPIGWVAELLHLRKEFHITRKPDNGGDKAYADVEALRSDYASGALHPGDLKPAVQKMLNEILQPVRSGLKEQDSLKKAVKDLEALSKGTKKK